MGVLLVESLNSYWRGATTREQNDQREERRPTGQKVLATVPVFNSSSPLAIVCLISHVDARAAPSASGELLDFPAQARRGAAHRAAPSRDHQPVQGMLPARQVSRGHRDAP